MSDALLSWGKYPRQPQTGHLVHWQGDVPSTLKQISVNMQNGTLAYGCGRSYGDSCLAVSDHVMVMNAMDRIVTADWETGLICAEAGMTLAELICIGLPRGWFPSVTPGTKFVTLGGAIANDVHGKNHHVKGTFGRHVERFSILRSDEGIVECSRTEHPDLFAATIGGLGLTGVILTVELQLHRVTSNKIDQLNIRFGGLDEFFDLSQTHDKKHEYTVAWIDCLASGAKAGRGYYMAGDHAQDGALLPAPEGCLSMPFDPPLSLVNPLTLRIFNTFYYHRQLKKETFRRISYDPFFYPLDRLLEWNRIYGKAGFQQFQCVVPQENAREVIKSVLKDISISGTGSFLAVLKQCGELDSPGLLSFPLHGVSLALDFPQRTDLNERLFTRLDELIHEGGGRLYPAKDAHMNPNHFKQAYPEWEKVESLRDPCLLSKFWKRVTQ